MRAVVVLLSGLWLAWSLPVGAADAPAGVWSAEVGTETGRLVVVWPAPTEATLAQADGVATLRAGRSITAPSQALTTRLSRWLRGTAPLAGAPGLALRLQPGVGARLSRLHPRLAVIEFASETKRIAPITTHTNLSTGTVVAETAIEPAAGPVRLIPIPHSRPDPSIEPPTDEPARAAEIGPVAEASATAPAPSEPPSAVKVSARSDPGEMELRFRWGRAVPAAVFERGRQLWVVFPDADASVAGWRSLNRPDVTAWLEPVATTGAGAARVFRFRMDRPIRIEPRADHSGWSIVVTPAGDEPHLDTTNSSLQRSAVPGALTVETEGVVAQLRDPASGERLGVAMTPPGGSRQQEAAKFVDLELLPSLQGLVWRPLADGVRGTVAQGRLTITRPGGLRLSVAQAKPEVTDQLTESPDADEHQATPALSDASPAEDEGAPVRAPEPSPAVMPVHAVGTLGLGSLGALDAAGRQQRRHHLIGDARSLAGLPRAQARLDLARLYLADALGPEARIALALIDDAEIATPTAAPLRTSKLALTGAAEALSGRHDPALASLLDRLFDEDAEIALWRAYAAAQAERWPLATQEWGRSGGLPEGYPDPLRRRLGLEMAATMLEHGSAAEAQALIAQLSEIRLPGLEGARLRLLEGIARLRDGRPAEAEAAFADAGKDGDGDIATRADFLLTSSRLDRGSLTPEAAIEALSAQRPSWRGHPWEARMLTRLADLQAMAGRAAASLTTRRAALSRATDPETASAGRGELRRYLEAELADGRGSPLRQLALYRVHGDLLDGDPAAPRLRAELAEAAATVGLTDTAAALLDAAGPAPEAAAARVTLAGALAARGEMDSALRQLGNAHGGEAPSAARLRAELRARAALAGGRPDLAAAAMAGGDSPATAGALLQEIAWRSGDWQDVARTAGSVLTAAGNNGELDPNQTNAAIWLGLAQSHLNDAAAASVAARYAGRLAEPQDAALLRLATLAEPAGDEGTTPSEVARLTAAVRADLGVLPTLAAQSAPVRTASARSAPEG